MNYGTIVLSPAESGDDGTLTVFVNDVLTIRADLYGYEGRTFDLTGDTLTGRLSTAAGAAVSGAVTITTTSLNIVEGQINVTLNAAATATEGTYTLTVTRTGSSTDVQTFGPFAVIVRAK